jgi:nitric oxide reductase subunit C
VLRVPFDGTGVNLVGPSLAGIATTAAARIKRTITKGRPPMWEGYIQESILSPNAYVVEGSTFRATANP